jgi:hypothetical protein
MAGLACITISADGWGMPAADPPSRTEIDEGSRAIEALQSIDEERLVSDSEYAQQILDYLDQAERFLPHGAGLGRDLDLLRLLALPAAQRPDDAALTLDRLLAGRLRSLNDFSILWIAALRLEDYPRAAAALDKASREMAARQWADIRSLVPRELGGHLLQQLQEMGDTQSRARIADALLRIGWSQPAQRATDDFLRAILIKERIRQGDREQARGLASLLTTPDTILGMILLKEYDDILRPGESRLAVLQQSFETHEQETADAVSAAPNNLSNVLERAHHLRSLGRDAEAFALLEPHLTDVTATAATPEGMWLVNDAAYALIRLDRTPQALDLMAQLAALPVADNPDLIGPSINYAQLLARHGESERALAHAMHIDSDLSDFANTYGRMWTWSAIVCALAGLDRHSDGASWLDRMQESPDGNPSAMMQAYLCLDDMDAAESLLIARLRSDQPETVLIALQDWRMDMSTPAERAIAERLRLLRERPAVAAELERVGRILTLPLPRAYWGSL